MSEQPETKSVGRYFEFDHGATWKEFKDAIDELLTENSISEDVPIWYIDISYPSRFGAAIEGEGLSIGN